MSTHTSIGGDVGISQELPAAFRVAGAATCLPPSCRAIHTRISRGRGAPHVARLGGSGPSSLTARYGFSLGRTASSADHHVGLGLKVGAQFLVGPAGHAGRWLWRPAVAGQRRNPGDRRALWRDLRARRRDQRDRLRVPRRARGGDGVTDLLSLPVPEARAALEQWSAARGEPGYRVRQILPRLWERPVRYLGRGDGFARGVTDRARRELPAHRPRHSAPIRCRATGPRSSSGCSGRRRRD